MPDARGYLLPNERKSLLQQYAPVLVLFPEDHDQAPYPDEGDAIYTVRGSYHPRAAELFVQNAEINYRLRALLREPSLLFRALLRSVVHGLPGNPRWGFAAGTYSAEVDLARLAVRAALNSSPAAQEEFEEEVKLARYDPRYAGLDEDQRRERILTRKVQQYLAQRVSGFNLPLPCVKNRRQWEAYHDLLPKTDPLVRRCTVYGRVMQGLAPAEEDHAAPGMAEISDYPASVNQRWAALQYWFHYYYDDWANRHEGDWEGITLLINLNKIVDLKRELTAAELADLVSPQDVGYASHEDGYSRLWPDVQKTAEGRPLVYVARGSSASYFAWKPDGYPTSATVGMVEKTLEGLTSWVGRRRFLGRRWDVEFGVKITSRDPKNTDWVPADPRPEDRLPAPNVDPQESSVPISCRGVRLSPEFNEEAGQALDSRTYHLETEDLFWLELVEAYGVRWGQNSLLPGSTGPSGLPIRNRRELRQSINYLLELQTRLEGVEAALEALPHHPPMDQLYGALQALLPSTLFSNSRFSDAIRRHIGTHAMGYVNTLWDDLLRLYPGLWKYIPLRELPWLRFRQRVLGRIRPSLGQPDPLLTRSDPLFHVKSLLAQFQRTRYELQIEGAKWDNPFAWVRYGCAADTFYYGIARSQATAPLDPNMLDCKDTELSVT